MKYITLATFREWLRRYGGMNRARQEYAELMERLSHVRSNCHFSRDEMNER
jgi:hypothetical protein